MSPVDGVVAQASAVAGQMAAPGAMVFQVVDPNRHWVEALSFDALTPAQRNHLRTYQPESPVTGPTRVER